jgi:hypothetical protein
VHYLYTVQVDARRLLFQRSVEKIDRPENSTDGFVLRVIHTGQRSAACEKGREKEGQTVEEEEAAKEEKGAKRQEQQQQQQQQQGGDARYETFRCSVVVMAHGLHTPSIPKVGVRV